MTNAPYLLPLSDAAQLDGPLLEAVKDVEREFDLPTQKLNQILDKFLWEFGKGLSEEATADTQDPFLCVPFSPRIVSSPPFSCVVARF